MAGINLHIPPAYTLPDHSLLFLKSDEEEYTYHHLYLFAGELKRVLTQNGWTAGSPRPFVLFAESNPSLLFLIAAAFILRVPVLPIHSGISDKDLSEIVARTDPFAFYGNRSFTDGSLSQINRIEVEFEEWIQSRNPEPPVDGFSDPDELAGIFSTSGSTGRAKLVPLRRRQIFFAAKASSEHLKPKKQACWLLCLPLNHVGGVSVIYRSLLSHSAIWLQNRFDATATGTLLAEQTVIEIASMVPTMLYQLLKDSGFRPHSGFRALLLGGGPITEKLVSEALCREIPVVTSYGMTETAAQIASNPLPSSGNAYSAGDVGEIFPPNEVQIRNEQGEPLPEGISGKVWLRGPQLFEGYYLREDPDPFDEMGWFHTGDFGKLTDGGHLSIESRRSDLIITGGENVSPAVIEEALEAMDEITRAAVIGVPDEIWGQKIVAFAEPEKGVRPVSTMLLSRLKRELLPHQIPKELILMEQLPVTTALKVKKNELLNLYTQNHSEK